MLMRLFSQGGPCKFVAEQVAQCGTGQGRAGQGRAGQGSFVFAHCMFVPNCPCCPPPLCVCVRSFVFAYYMFGQSMFKEDFTPEANAINQALFEDKQAQLEAEVEQLRWGAGRAGAGRCNLTAGVAGRGAVGAWAERGWLCR